MDTQGPDRARNEAPETGVARMRALAHPLRIQLIERIGRRGKARATDLAAELSVPVNSVSYHLRQLGRAGILQEETASEMDKRSRVWTLEDADLEAVTHFARSGRAGNPDVAEVAAATDSAAIEWMRLGYLHALTAQPHDSEAEPRAPWLFPTSVVLTANEAKDFYEAAYDLLVEYKSRHRAEDGSDLPVPHGERLDEYRVLFAIAPELGGH